MLLLFEGFAQILLSREESMNFVKFKQVTIIDSDEFLDHDNGRFHPEKPDRLLAIRSALDSVSWKDRLIWQSPTPLSQRDALGWVKQYHNNYYVDRVAHLAQEGGGRLSGDTVVSPRSYEVALLAINAWFDGVDRVLATKNPAFILCRPPGHHATEQTGMGFCLFSNIAITAHYALTLPNINRVAILDWDVHHGNGTENIVQNNPNIAFCSLHQFPHYPGTGKASYQGIFENLLNIPLPAESNINDYQEAFEEKVIPFLQNFNPDILLVSAGYDAHTLDPLSDINLESEDFGQLTEYILALKVPIVFGLEGGYHLQALGESVCATLEACLTLEKTE